MGIVALTDRRLLFLEKSIGNESLVEFALDSIGAMSLGKKMGGETLKITHSGTSATITTLQHGQGDAIARKFRELKDRSASSTGTVMADPIAQIERLAELRDRGILSEDEFATQKTQLLSTLWRRGSRSMANSIPSRSTTVHQREHPWVSPRTPGSVED